MVLPQGLEGKEAHAYKRQFIRSAARIWQASDEQQAPRRQHRFCEKWEQEQALAVDKLRQDFEGTLTFYRIQDAAALRGQKWPPITHGPSAPWNEN